MCTAIGVLIIRFDTIYEMYGVTEFVVSWHGVPRQKPHPRLVELVALSAGVSKGLWRKPTYGVNSALCRERDQVHSRRMLS